MGLALIIDLQMQRNFFIQQGLAQYRQQPCRQRIVIAGNLQLIKI